MEIFGIIAYSWVVSSISNYIQVINEKNEDYEKKCKILEDIKMSYPQLPDHLYEKISRYLKYKQDNEKLDKKIIFDSLPIGLSNILVCEMYKPIINNFVFFKNFDNVDFIVKVVLNFIPILAIRNDILINYGELVEDMIFVKKGKLSLELPLILKPNKETKTNNKKVSINQTFSYKKQLLNKTEENNKKDDEEIQVFKLLEIRKNEHFGDILMFLNLQSPLTLRTKTKKAELFYLHKTAAVEISTSYPLIWKQINKKSLYNYEQIKKLMNKVLKIFHDSQLKYINVLNINEEDTLQSSFLYESSESGSSFSSKTESNFSRNSWKMKKKNTKITLNTINELEDYENNQKLPKSSKDFIENSYETSNWENDVINEEVSNESNDSYKNNSSFHRSAQTKDLNENSKYYLTPFKPEEINDEIYPDDYFFCENYDRYKTNINNDNLLINENKSFFNKSMDIEKMNNKNNISICSTVISFTLNSEYENINELSDYKYSKDLKLKQKVHRILKNEEEKKRKLVNEEEIELIYFKSLSKVTSNPEEPKKTKIRKNRRSKSYFKSNEQKIKSIFKSSNSNETEIGKSKKRNNKKTFKKKNLLTTINKNIERNQINLNNPELFYSEYFHKILDKKKAEHGEAHPLNKEMDHLMNKLQKKSTFSKKTSFNTNNLVHPISE
jgi:hypothetical protein